MNGKHGSYEIPAKGPLAATLFALCPAAAVSTRVIDALWMSLGIFSVLVLSSLCISAIGALRGKPEAGETPGWGIAWMGGLFITACLTAVYEMALAAFAPGAAESLGIYVPLISVACIVLSRIDAYSNGCPVGRAVRDAAGLGLGFAGGLAVMTLVREVLGAGTITLFPVGGFGGTVEVPGIATAPARALLCAAGGLICVGYLVGFVQLVRCAKGKGEAASAENPREAT